MKDYPQNKEQWADEAYQSMKLAWTVLTQTNPFPSDIQKEKLIEIAADLACENRDIKDESYIQHARTFAVDEFMVDYSKRDMLQTINFALCYVLAYFDAHLSLSMITEDEAKEAITHLKTNFDLTLKEKATNNVFSIDFSKNT